MIKIAEGYMLRKVLDINLILGIGDIAYNPKYVMSVNNTGAFLWEKLIIGAEKKQLVDCLLSEYNVSEEIAEADVDIFLSQLQEKALIEIC